MPRLLELTLQHFREDSFSIFIFRLLRAIIAEYTEIVKAIRLKLFWLKNRDSIVVKEIQGNRMHLSLKDKGISRGLIAHGFWEPLATQVMRENIREGDVVLDIGANMGYFALQESKLVGPTGKVYAIEPVAANIELLKKNIEINGCTNIEVNQLAAGNVDEESNIYLSDRLNCGCMVYREGINKVHTVPVQQTTVDRFLQGRRAPDFVRMDVEGYEFEIIEGMTQLLESRKPMKMLIELHPGYLGAERLGFMLDKLDRYGFICQIAVDRQLDSRSKLLQHLFYYFSGKVNSTPSDGTMFRNTKLSELKKFGSRPIYPHVLFARS